MEKLLKVIFLDIDGVLATETSCLAYGMGEWTIDPTLAAVAAKFCEHSGAKIVISSSWRKRHTFESMMDVLTTCGLSKYLYKGEDWHTPKGGGGNRGDKIKRWLENTKEKIDKYVIVDDDDGFDGEQKKNLIRTYSQSGFNKLTYIRALIHIGAVEEYKSHENAANMWYLMNL